MEHYEREFFISRIDAGYIKYKCRDDRVLRINAPSTDVVYTAHEIYMDTLMKAQFQGSPSAEDVFLLLNRS